MAQELPYGKLPVNVLFMLMWLGTILLTSSAVGETCGFGDNLPCCSTVASTVNGICVAPANNKYEFTIKRFCFEKSDGSLVCTGSTKTFNAAAVTIGADMGNFISGVKLEGLNAGDTIVAMRPEVSKTFIVNGGGGNKHTTTDGVACSTGGDRTETMSTDPDNNPFPSCSTSPSADPCETSDGFLRIRDTSLGNITLTQEPLVINFDFDVGSGVTFATGGGACTYQGIGPLSVTMSRQ
ncbi:MAG: hypothetical protein D6704_13420 [Nitrospirae bacterium]|nr:MAG: hypothetical protein D6704_13420 [Nitrospirota bacterium]